MRPYPPSTAPISRSSPQPASALLRADQVQWLAWVQLLCHANDGIMTPADTAACLHSLYAERIKTLRKAVTRRDGLSFLNRTQYLATPEAGKPAANTPYPGFGTLQGQLAHSRHHR